MGERGTKEGKIATKKRIVEEDSKRDCVGAEAISL